GLHIRLEDEQGVDAIQVRGGVHARLVADVGSYDDPDSGKTFHTFTGKTPNSMALLTPRLKTSRISFYDVKDGVIADVGFYRLSDEIPAHEAALTYDLLPMDAAPPAVASLAEAMGELTEDSLYGLRSTTDKIGGPGVHAWSMKHPQHAVLVPQTNEVSLTALSLKADWRVNQPTLLTVQVRDPVHPMHSLTTVTIEVDRSGPATLVIDFPDQVIQAGKMVWLVLTPESELMLASPQVVLYTTSREAAVHEALPFHLLRMNGFYTPLSEGRPWNVLYRHEDIYAGWRERYADYWPYLESLMAAMAHCRYLDPGNALAEQVESWFYRRPNSRSGVSVLRPPVLPTIPDAPDWAIVARQAWLETRSVAEWWLLNRLVKTGEFGTEVNDDSCLYQNFANFPMFEDSGVGEGVQRAGREFWNHIVEDGYLEFGLNANQDDPLHAYEEGINHESMVAWWHYGDPTFLEQCMLATKSIESLTTVNAAGHRHFNSHFVSSADVRNPRPPESDGHCHAQLMHPVLEVARYNRNPLATRLLTEYAQSWLAHMQTPGEYATEIDTISDAVLATATEPFTEGMSCQMSVMLTAAEVNEDPSFVAPVVEYLLRRDKPYFMQGYIHDLYQLGYLDAMVWGGADGYADYFKQFSPAVAWAETGDKDHLLKDLEMEIAEIQTFRSIYTDIEPFADRVFLDNERKLTTSTIAYTGGYATLNKPFHSHAVSWGGFGTNFAAMVQQGRKDSFSAVLYNFAPVQLRGTMRLWNLEHGDYSMSTGLDTDGDAVGDVGVVSRRVTVRKGDPIPLHLTPRAVTAVSFTRLQARDPIWKRADLALSPRELKIQGSTLSGLVHNIGSQPAKQVSISLATRDGKVIETQELGALASPDDLVPRTVPFAFRQLPADRSDLVVIGDIRNVIDEITEGNNALRVVDSSLP
ncbi:MAG: hypothetical protein O3A51_10040, partial [Verrucomicrobia bacterium]|nr:hypothetical protein [Verrucomicrobiota bacterium]